MASVIVVPDNRDTGSQMSAIEEIKRLKARYGRCVDTKDWAGYLAVFTDDARLEYGSGVWDDPRAMVAFFAEMFEGAVSMHEIHSPEVEVLGPDEAVGVWTFTDRVQLRDGSPHDSWTGSGRYWETYRRVDGEWRIASVRVERVHIEPLRH